MKKLFTILLKIGLSAAIIAYLVWDATRPNEQGVNVFANLVHQPKNWGFLAAALVFCAAAVTLTLIRWWYLACALELPLPFTDALRIGFLAFLINLAPLGIVGGDLLKAVMLARRHREDRPKAVASVAVDRMIGLYMLFVVATVAILLTGFAKLPVAEIRMVCKLTFILTAVGALAIMALLTPGLTEGRLSRALGRIPRIGRVIESLIEAVRMYRRKPQVLIAAAVMSVGVHSLFATGVYFIARGLPGDDLSISTHFVIMPVSAVTGVLPLPMGPFEAVLEFLYTRVPGEALIPNGQGLVVALGYRLITVLIAIVGLLYYFGSRQEVARVMHEVDNQPAAG